MSARVILALAVEADDRAIWDRLKILQPEMFSAGALEVKFAFFGAESARSSRPCITTRWATDAPVSFRARPMRGGVVPSG